MYHAAGSEYRVLCFSTDHAAVAYEAVLDDCLWTEKGGSIVVGVGEYPKAPFEDVDRGVLFEQLHLGFVVAAYGPYVLPVAGEPVAVKLFALREHSGYDILHIHGCISNPQSLQFGNPEQTPTIVNKKFEDIYGEDEFYGMSIEPGVNNYVNLAEAFSKDVNSNIPILTNFITDKEINEIVIMGHSYLGVDKAYYEKVLNPRFQKAKWIIYCHKKRDYVAAQNYIAEKKLNGISVYWNE